MKKEKSFLTIKRNGTIISLEYIGKDENYRSVLPSEFLSVNEIVEHILSNMTNDNKVKFRSNKREDLILFHHGYGTWIRNTYGLWHPKNPFVISNDLGDGHPDGLSMLVIYGIFDKLNPTAYDNAMSIIQEK